MANAAATLAVAMVRRLMALAGIKGGDEAVRNGAAQDDLFAALLYQHPRGKIVAASAVAPVRLGLG